MCWDRLSHSIKGGVIASVIGIVLFVISFILNLFPLGMGILDSTVGRIIFSPLYLILKPISELYTVCNGDLCSANMALTTLTSLLFIFILGAIIGTIIHAVQVRTRKESKDIKPRIVLGFSMIIFGLLVFFLAYFNIIDNSAYPSFFMALSLIIIGLFTFFSSVAPLIIFMGATFHSLFFRANLDFQYGLLIAGLGIIYGLLQAIMILKRK